MSHDSFVSSASQKLSDAIRQALAGVCSPLSVSAAAEAIMAEWDVVRSEAPAALVEGERELWCGVWSAQHLGDEEHWKDGSAQRVLEPILKALEGASTLPENWIGKRP